MPNFGDAESSGCPGATPADGSPCPSVGLACVYGTNVILACNQIAECKAGAWRVAAPPSACVTSACPTSYPPLLGVAAAPACAQSATGTNCSYPEGACACSAGTGGPAEPLGWYCYPEVAGCPYPTPDAGAACTEPGQICGASCGPASMICDGGAWQPSGAICPV